MILQREASIFSTSGLRQLIGTALAYGLLIGLCNSYLMTVAGNELRPSTFIPVISGLLFGLPAAVGSFAGVLFSSLLTGYGLLHAIFSGIINFLLAYTPYRLWYGFQSHKATLYVYNNRTFFKFVLINLIGGSSLSVLLAFYFHGMNRNLNWGIIFITFINNFAFPLILGLPILLLWSKYCNKKYYRPYEEPPRHYFVYRIALPLLFILEAAGLLMLFAGKMLPHEGFIFAGIGVCLWFCSLQRSSDYHTHPEEAAGFHSLVSEVTFRFFIAVDILILIFLLIWIAQTDNSLSFWRAEKNWVEFYRIISICLIVFISGTYLVLLVIERTLTQRLKRLCARVKSFHTTRNLAELRQKKSISVYKNELDIMEYSLHKMGSDITRYLEDLDNTIAEQKSINTQLNVAASIQHGILPKLEQIRPDLKGYQIKGGMKAAKSIGGDTYDAFLLDDDHLLISIADVSGKGIPAALFMMITHALLRENTKALPLAKAVEQTNNVLIKHNEQCFFVTVWLACLELSTGRIKYINAGHNPSLLATGGAKKAFWLDKLSGPVLGLMPDSTYTIHEAEIPSGGRLFLYTDGLNEAENASHEFFGNERLEESFLSASEPGQILTAIHHFVLDTEQSDDMTYLWLERKEIPHPSEK